MKITIVVATLLEVKPLIAFFNLQKSENQHVYTNEDGSLHVLVTGMGMMNTAAHTAIYACKNVRDLMIDAGIAGAFNRNIGIGAVLEITEETYGDFGVEDGDTFMDFFDLGFIDKKEDAFEYGKMSPIQSAVLQQQLQHLPKASSLTVNKVHGNPATIEALMKKYPADLENMEGLAFFYVCRQLGLPSAQIRSVSNYVERRNKENWDIGLAVKNLNQTLIDLLLLWREASFL